MKDMEVIDTKYYKGLVFERIKDDFTPNIYTVRVWQNEVGVTSVLMQCFEITYEEDIHQLYVSYFFLIKRHLASLESNLILR
jgi:hypothetical protein